VTSPDIDLSPEEVRRHAAAVDEFGRMIDEALGAARHIRHSNESYGRLVGPMFTAILNPIQDDAITVIRNAVSATQSLADRLRAMASNVDTADGDAGRRFGGNGD
jgi:hypothetical protein